MFHLQQFSHFKWMVTPFSSYSGQTLQYQLGSSLSHRASNPSEDHYSSTFKTCPESNCFHWDLLDPIMLISCLCYYNSLLTGLPSSLLFLHHSLFSIVSKSSNGSPFYSKSFWQQSKILLLKVWAIQQQHERQLGTWDTASQALHQIK